MVGVLDPFGDPEKSMVFKDLFLSLDHECPELSIGSAPLYHFRTLSINIYSKFAHCMNNNHKLLSPPWESLHPSYPSRSIVGDTF